MVSYARVGALAALMLVAGAAPVPAAETDYTEFMPEACAEAESVAARRLRILLMRSDVRATWLLGSNITTLKAARGHCLSGNPERAILLYRHIIETLRDEEVRLESELAETGY